MIANNGNKKAGDIVGLTANTTAKIAEPEPTRFIGPQKNPSGVNIANTIAKTNEIAVSNLQK